MKKDNPQVFIVFDNDDKIFDTAMGMLKIKIVTNECIKYIDTDIRLYKYQWNNGIITNHPQLKHISSVLNAYVSQTIRELKKKEQAHA